MKFPYIILIGLAVAAVWMLNGKYYQEELTLFGFAETKETEINLNFPVMVEKLNVLPIRILQCFCSVNLSIIQ